MKVLMIEFFYPENSYTEDLGVALNPYVDLTIACKKNVVLPKDGICWKPLLYEGYHSRLAAPFLYAKSLWQIARDIKKNHYDVVHIQYMRAPKYEVRLFLSLRRHYKILVNTIHTLVPHEASEGDFALHREIYQKCDLMVVHNRTCKERLIKEYGVSDDRICIMPHGLYTVEAKERTVSGLAVKEKTLSFLMFGQMRRYKGVDILLEAAAMIPKELRGRIRITVAGPQYHKIDGTDYAGMVQTLGIADFVTLMPRHIPKEEHSALFADADICVFPYRELYGSGALIMAYAFEKPVIVSDDPIFKEETDDGETGVLVKKEDPQALCNAMIAALSWTEEDFERRKHHIRLMNREKYSWEKSAGILCRAYEDTLKRKK